MPEDIRLRRVPTLLLLYWVVGGICGAAEKSGAEEAPSASDAEASWATTVAGYRSEKDRRDAFARILPRVTVLATTNEVQATLDRPNSVVAANGLVLWTYVLYHGAVAQLVFGGDGRLQSRHDVVFRCYVVDWGKASERPPWSVVPEYPRPLEVPACIGTWRAIGAVQDGLWEDKHELAERIASAIGAGLARDDIRTMLGEPMGVLGGGTTNVWSYPTMLQNAFLQVWFGGKGCSTRLCARRYEIRTGMVAVSPADQEWSEHEHRTADTAAWLCTKDVGRGAICRRGIGKRMETYLKKGMTKEEVLELMGQPDNKSTNRLGQNWWLWTLHTDSSTGVDIDSEGKVRHVHHFGT
jgi:outer membrane protein assembly factor BamE (lipoprotein component of BamABCDE complex)